MEFLALTGAQLLGLLAVAGGATVVLYLLKLRRRRVLVPSSRLWERILAERPASDLFAWIKRLVSLLVQLVLVTLLVLALGDPRLGGSFQGARAMVVLLDGSASMQATDVPGGRV